MSAEPETKRRKLQPYVVITSLRPSPTQNASTRKPISSPTPHRSLPSSHASETRSSPASVGKMNGATITKSVAFGRRRESFSRTSSVTSISSHNEVDSSGGSRKHTTARRAESTHLQTFDGLGDRFRSSSVGNGNGSHGWIGSRDTSPDEMLLSSAQIGLPALREEGQLSQDMNDLVIREGTPRSSSSRQQPEEDFVERFHALEYKPSPAALSLTSQPSIEYNSRPSLSMAMQSLSAHPEPALIQAASQSSTKPVSESAASTLPYQVPATPIAGSSVPPSIASPGIKLEAGADEEKAPGPSRHICLAEPILERIQRIQECDLERVRQQLDSHAPRTRKGKERFVAHESSRTITPAQRYLELLEHMYGPGDPRRGHLKKRPQFKVVLPQPSTKRATFNSRFFTDVPTNASDSGPTPSSSRNLGEGLPNSFQSTSFATLEQPSSIDDMRGSLTYPALDGVELQMLNQMP